MTLSQNSVAPRQELRAYEAALPSIVDEHTGEYVVIKGESLVRFFADRAVALDWAYEQFGLEPFFVKRVSPQTAVAHFTRDLGPCRR
jgi:hypothetical protein